jgi:ankyrin repeat protein
MKGFKELLQMFHQYLAAEAGRRQPTHKVGPIEARRRPTPLMLAARFGHLDCVREIIGYKNAYFGLVEDCNEWGFTALHLATVYRHLDVVKCLLDCGRADVHATTRGHLKYPMAFAAALGYAEVVEYFLKNDEKKPTREATSKAMCAAAANGEKRVVSCLLAYDETLFDAEDDSKSRRKSITLAAGSREPTIVHLLLEAGGFIESTSEKPRGDNDDGDNSPVIKPSVTTDSTTVGSVREADDLKCILADIPIERQLNIDGRSTVKYLVASLYQEAARKGDIDEINELLVRNYDAQSTDQYGNSFFHVAAAENQYKVLAEFSVKLQHLQPLSKKNDFGETPLHLAVKNSHKKSAKELLKNVCHESLQPAGSDCNTPLHIAVKIGNTDIVKSLVRSISLNQPELLNNQNREGRTALHYAVLFNRLECIVELRALNPCPVSNRRSFVPTISDSALHLAAASADTSSLETLLKTFFRTDSCAKRCDIDELDCNGRTALVICVKTANVKGVELLLKHGSDVRVTDCKGKNVFHHVVKAAVKRRLTMNRRLMSNDPLMEIFRMLKESCDAIWMRSAKYHETKSAELVYQEYGRKDYISDVFESMTTVERAEIRRFEDHCKEGMTVLQLASALGAADLMAAILEVTHVISVEKNKHSFSIMYKLSDILPPKLIGNDDGNMYATSETDCHLPNRKLSCLELLSRDGIKSELFADMLHVQPLRKYIDGFAMLYSAFCFLLMLVHVCYMTLFSISVIPTCHINATVQSLFDEYKASRDDPRRWFCLYPGLVAAYQVARLVSTFAAILRLKMCRCISLRKLYYLLTEYYHCFVSADENTSWQKYYLYDFISTAASVLFCFLTLAWYVLYLSDPCTNDVKYYNYAKVVAVLIVVGWLYTIEYLRSMRIFQIFSKYLKVIFFSDVLRIVLVYTLIWAGFSFAIRVCLQAVSNNIEHYETSSVKSARFIFFGTFGLIFSAQDMLGYKYLTDSTDQILDTSIGNFFQVLLALYFIFAQVMLLNVLIAMINHSHKEVNAHSMNLWYLENMRSLLCVEQPKKFVSYVVAKCLRHVMLQRNSSHGLCIVVEMNRDQFIRLRQP